jgi:lipoprotein-anchoring transpeptidase ErfK/SrfK
MAATIIAVAAAGALAAENIRQSGTATAGDNAGPVRRIVISIPDRKLALLQDDKIVRIWNTAVGTKSTPSPAGTYTIINRVSQPSYYRSGKVIPPGPDNPVGTRWLGLSLKGFGIHGTNDPRSIGRKASHGCIRMQNRDVEELFDMVRVGDVVELHKERNEQLAGVFGTGGKPKSVPDARAAAAVTPASGQ